jgi:hypothetical protein
VVLSKPSDLPLHAGSSPEDALDCACGLYLNDPRLAATPDELTVKSTQPPAVKQR